MIMLDRYNNFNCFSHLKSKLYKKLCFFTEAYNLYQKFLLFLCMSQNKYQKYQNEKYFLVFLKSCIRGIRLSKNFSVLLRTCISGIRMTKMSLSFFFEVKPVSEVFTFSLHISEQVSEVSE